MEPSPNESESPSESPESPPASGPAPAPGPTVNDLERWIGTRLGWYGDQLDSQRWAALWKTLQTNQWQLDNEAREAAITWGPHCRLTSTETSSKTASQNQSHVEKAGPRLLVYWRTIRKREIEQFIRKFWQLSIPARRERWTTLKERCGADPALVPLLNSLKKFLRFDASGLLATSGKEGQVAHWLCEIALATPESRYKKSRSILNEVAHTPEEWTTALIQLWKAFPAVTELCPSFQYDWLGWIRSRLDIPVAIPKQYLDTVAGRELSQVPPLKVNRLQDRLQRLWNHPKFNGLVYVWSMIIILCGGAIFLSTVRMPGNPSEQSWRDSTRPVTSYHGLPKNFVVKTRMTRLLMDFLYSGLNEADWSLNSLQTFHEIITAKHQELMRWPNYQGSGFTVQIQDLEARIQAEQRQVQLETNRPPAPLLPDQKLRRRKSLTVEEHLVLHFGAQG